MTKGKIAMGKKTSKLVAIKSNIKKRFITGLLLLMPFGVAFIFLHWLFVWMAGFLKPVFLGIAAWFLDNAEIKTEPGTYLNITVSAFSIIILLIVVYIFGVIGHFVFGKRLIHSLERLVLKIPLVRTIYGATKQVMNAFSLPEQVASKSVVLVEFPRQGFKAIGFLTGYIKDSKGNELCKVFIPTTPNPTTGFFEIVPKEEIIEITTTVEDAFKMIISGGIISPEKLCEKKA